MLSPVGEGEPPLTLPDGGELELFSFGPPQWRLREVTETFACLLGVTGAEINGRCVLDLVPEEDRPALEAALNRVNRKAASIRLESRFVQSDGHIIYVQWLGRRLDDGLWQVVGTDVADLVTLLADRRALKARLDLAIGQATAAMWDLDLREERFGWEPQAAEIFGVSPEAMPAGPTDFATAADPRDSEAVVEAFHRLRDEGTTDLGVRINPESGSRYLSVRGRVIDRDLDGSPARAVGLLIDVTTEKAMEEQLLRMSASDALTGTPNRRAFDQALRGEWRRSSSSGQPLSLVMVDIDSFKAFNDTYGHLVGDQALIAVARAMSATLRRDGALLARYGGEEFAIVLPATDAEGARVVASRLLDAVRAITIRQAPGWELSISAGTATWHPASETIKSPALLARADEALYAAKAANKNCVVAYEDFLAPRDVLKQAITEGLARGEFELYYQPLVDVRDGGVEGFEALIRWNRPGYGLVAPDLFIPVAESSDLICELGRWVLQEAVSQLASWVEAMPEQTDSLRVAVNVSARHAAMPELVDDISAALGTAGLAAERLEVELTETALQEGPRLATILGDVRRLGVRVAIDDFGSGYTSVSQLAYLPADTLKVDRQFVSSEDPRHQSLVELIIEAAHTFGLRVVAEGIETDETLRTMRSLSCDVAQGFLVAKPMPAAAVPGWLARQPAHVPALVEL